MSDREEAYQRACLETLKPLVGRRVRTLIRDDEGNFGFAMEDGTAVWIMSDPEGNGPGFADVTRP